MQKKTTQFRKERKAQDFDVVVAFIKKKKSKSKTSLEKYLQLRQQSGQQSEKQNTLKEETSRTVKPSGLNSEPNVFTDSNISILMSKIKLGVLVIQLHCTSYLNYSTFKNIRLLS